jgi:hypothetical protein
MDGDQHPSRAALRAQRERVLERLSEGFVRDELGLEEFERRVDRAHAATDVDALAPLVDDIEPALARALPSMTTAPVLARTPESAPTTATALAVPTARTAGGDSLAVFGNVERRGRFELRDGARATAVFGNIELDLRDVELPAGVTTLHLRAVCGNIEITVPPTLAVECLGSGILGSFASVNRVPPRDEPGPRLRIVGSAVLGNVEVHTRPRPSGRDRARLPQR